MIKKKKKNIFQPFKYREVFKNHTNMNRTPLFKSRELF